MATKLLLATLSPTIVLFVSYIYLTRLQLLEIKGWQPSKEHMCFTVALLDLADVPELRVDSDSEPADNRGIADRAISARDCLGNLCLPRPRHVIHRSPNLDQNVTPQRARYTAF